MPQHPNAKKGALEEETVFPVGRRGELHVLSTGLFKSARFSLVTLLPQTRKTAVLCPLLLSVLTEGCEGYPSFEAISCRSDDLWGSVLSAQDSLRRERRFFGFSVCFVDPSYLPEKIALLADLADLVRRILFFPLLDENGLFPAKTVALAKQRQCDSIRALVSSPRRYAAEHSETFFFGDRPCGIPDCGSEEETNAVTPEELTAFWRDWRKTAFFRLFYTGATDPAEVAGVLTPVFEDLFCGKAAKEPPFRAVPAPEFAAAVRRKEEPFPIEQGHLILGFQTGGDLPFGRESAALLLANEVLGGAPTSLLFMNVRERMSLCYSISSSYSAFRSSLFIKCALDPANRETAEREILRQVERLTQGDFTDAELEAAHSSLIFAYRAISDDPESLERLMIRCALTPDRRTPEEMIAELQSLSRKDVVRAAKRLSPETIYFLRGNLKERQHEN